MDYWDELENLPADEYARQFRHFTPAQLRDSMQARGLDVDCEDPETLTALARIDVRYLRERAAEAPVHRLAENACGAATAR